MPVVNMDVECRGMMLGHLTSKADTEYIILQEAQRKFLGTEAR